VIKRGPQQDTTTTGPAGKTRPAPSASSTSTLAGGQDDEAAAAETVRVSDEFVQLKGAAVLKCRLQSSLGSADRGDLFWPAEPGGLVAVAAAAAELQTGAPLTADQHQHWTGRQAARLVVEWFTSDGLQVSPSEPLAKGKSSPRAPGR
jgi:hypothetical protein